MSSLENTPTPSALAPWAARTLVFASSGAVLILEILAGRLLAPYVGVSLETFTGIIGTVLAGIAVGAWAGGELCDHHDPRALMGPALAAGGALSWLALPIVSALGPQFGEGPAAIVTLTAAAFFLPAAVLTSVSPMVAKLTLQDLQRTGSVVGGLSAAGTIGALAGTFLTGFVLVAALPTRPIVMLLGSLLVAAGGIVHLVMRRGAPRVPLVVALLACGVIGATSSPPCDHETGYFCVRVVADDDNPTGRSLFLDELRHAYVDLDDPTNLDIRYIRLFAQVADALPAGGIDSLHIGGGGVSFPRYLQHVRPGSTDLVLEIDDDLVRIVEDELGLVQTEALQVHTGDARLALDDLGDDRYDLVVGDAFASTSVPWHLTTREFVAEIDRVMRPEGLYVMNVIDGGANRFARAELATLQERFAHVALIVPAEGGGGLAVNQVLVASASPLPDLDIAAEDGRLVSGSDLVAYIDGADPLRDDFAPVDQLLD